MTFAEYPAWTLDHPEFVDALHALIDGDIMPPSAGAHLDAVVELASARESTSQGEWGSNVGAP
jgi:hypothetical protein